LINLEGKWIRRYGKIASILENPGSKTATGSASSNSKATAWRFLAQCPYGSVYNICVLRPFNTPCDRNDINISPYLRPNLGSSGHGAPQRFKSGKEQRAVAHRLLLLGP